MGWQFILPLPADWWFAGAAKGDCFFHEYDQEYESMARHGAVTFKGNPLTLVGEEVRVGAPAPEFDLVRFDWGMSHVHKADLLGKPSIISVVPSLDTQSVRCRPRPSTLVWLRSATKSMPSR